MAHNESAVSDLLDALAVGEGVGMVLPPSLPDSAPAHAALGACGRKCGAPPQA